MLEHWAAAGRRVALATLVDVRGSSPRPLGSEMAISDAGEIAGYVSGGCVEAAVATQAQMVLKNGNPVLLDYGAGSPVLDVQLACGGRIGILVRALTDVQDYIGRLRLAREARTAIDVYVNSLDGSHYFVNPGASLKPSQPEDYFCKRYLPNLRLMLAGSDPCTLALCQLAPAYGYEVGLLRPYGPAAPPPGTALYAYDTRPLGHALRDIEWDSYCAVYTLTHDMDDDHAVLTKALDSPVFSIGALGSQRKALERNARLRAQGISEEQIKRISTPAGMDIGAREPSEIALSILAELTARRPRETLRVSLQKDSYQEKACSYEPTC